MAGKNINTLYQEAVARFQQGRLNEARKLAGKIVKLRPDSADACHLLGVIELQAGHPGAAARQLGRATRLNPGHAVFFNNFGLALHAEGRSEEALVAFKRAVSLNPGLAGAQCNLGNELLELGQLTEALAASDRALQSGPRDIDARLIRATAAARLGRMEEALASSEQAVQLEPGRAQAWNVRGSILRQAGRLQEALSAFEQAIRIQSAYAEAYSNIGAIQNALGNHELAVEACEQAIRINPNYADAHSNLGVALGDLGQTEQALAAFARTIQLIPGHADAHYNRALLLLQTGDMDNGWQEYEWRWKSSGPVFVRRDFHLAHWDGSPLDGKRLLVFAEQGIGDEIMFASHLPDLASLNGEVVVECDARLQSLFTRSFPDINFIGTRQRSTALLAFYDRPVDCEVAAGSLPLLIRKLLPSCPGPRGYLATDPVLLQKWQERLAGYAGTLKIGISWRGGAQPKSREARSIPLIRWLPLLVHPGFTVVNLQYGDHAWEVDQLQQLHGVSVLDWEDLDQREDIDDLAALICALDLVISVDNMTVHLAGALGEPTATLLPRNADWRWGLDAAETDWYPSMRLFRQHQTGDWDTVIHEVSAYAESLRDTNTDHGRHKS